MTRVRVEPRHPDPFQAARSASSPKSPFRVDLGARTPLDAHDVKPLLAEAWLSVVGSSPNPRAVSVLTAHWALETDDGRAMRGHNFAGIKAAPSAAGSAFRTIEGHGATRREVIARFRVYESARAGAHDYLRLLATHYPAALEAASTGNVSAFAGALAGGGYFTADPHAYAQGIAQRFASLEGGTAAGASRPASPPGPALGSALEGLLRAFRSPTDEP